MGKPAKVEQIEKRCRQALEETPNAKHYDVIDIVLEEFGIEPAGQTLDLCVHCDGVYDADETGLYIDPDGYERSLLKDDLSPELYEVAMNDEYTAAHFCSWECLVYEMMRPSERYMSEDTDDN